jgi:DNA-binding LytR/AlgR family response regulator
LNAAKYDFKTHIFPDGKQLLSFHERIDVLFLDIDMPEMDGFQTAEKLYLKVEETVIIFLTSYTKDFQKAFRVRAFRYLLKPINISEFNEAIRDAINEMLIFKRIIIDDGGSSTVLVPESKIIYIESIGDNTAVHTESHGVIVCGRTLKDWQTDLDQVKFVRSHRTFIINFDHVKKIDDRVATLMSGDVVPIAARSTRAVKESLREYVRIKSR